MPDFSQIATSPIFAASGMKRGSRRMPAADDRNRNLRVMVSPWRRIVRLEQRAGKGESVIDIAQLGDHLQALIDGDISRRHGGADRLEAGGLCGGGRLISAHPDRPGEPWIPPCQTGGNVLRGIKHRAGFVHMPKIGQDVKPGLPYHDV